MKTIHTDLVARLQRGDSQAWFELSRTFGPAIASAVGRFGARRFSPDTVKDLTQETLAEVARSIRRFDGERGVRFSTWLLQIARYVSYGAIDRRMAKKRGEGKRTSRLDDLREPPADAHLESPDRGYEHAIFRAKVYKALEDVSAARPFLEVEAYRLRLTTRMPASAIADEIGVSAPSVSRYLKRVRGDLRDAIRRVVAEYSFTDEEQREIESAGLAGSEDLFDEAVSDLYLEEHALRMGRGGRA